MNTLDTFITHRIIDFLNVPSCKSNDVSNIKCVNRELKSMIQDYKKFKKHRVVKIKNNNSKIKWKHVNVCLTCNRINDSDLQELLSIRDKFTSKRYNSWGVPIVSSSSIYIHRKTQQELETFIVKLRRVTSNVVISRNYCCDGKGVEIELS